MSAAGQSRRFGAISVMSGLPLMADIQAAGRFCREGPEADLLARLLEAFELNSVNDLLSRIWVPSGCTANRQLVPL